MATLEEWLTHAVGGPLLRQAVGVDANGRPTGVLGDEEMLALVGSFPISALAAMPGFGVTQAIVETLVRSVSPPCELRNRLPASNTP